MKSEIETLRQIVDTVMSADIMKTSREMHLVNARLVFTKIMRERGYRLSEISKCLNKHHATIIHYLRQVDYILKQDDRIMEQYLTCSNLFLKQAPIEDRLAVKSRLDLETTIINLRDEIRQLMDERKQVIGILDRHKRLQPIIEVIEKRTPFGQEDSIKRKIICMFNE